MYHVHSQLNTHRICPNRSAVHKCKGLGPCLKNFKYKAYGPVPTAVVCTGTHFCSERNYMDLCLQGIGNLLMCCCSQMDQNITQILLFLDDQLLFYQAFHVIFFFNRCGTCM